jgi:hypothetical protein
MPATGGCFDRLQDYFAIQRGVGGNTQNEVRTEIKVRDFEGVNEVEIGLFLKAEQSAKLRLAPCLDEKSVPAFESSVSTLEGNNTPLSEFGTTAPDAPFHLLLSTSSSFSSLHPP